MKQYCPKCKEEREIDIAYRDAHTIYGDCEICKSQIRIAKNPKDQLKRKDGIK